MKFSDIDTAAASDRIERREVDMTEFWGDPDSDPVIVYARSPTPADYRKVNQKHKGFTNDPKPDGLCYLLCLIAQDENGEPFFKLEDRLKLVNMEIEILQPLFSLIGGEISDEDVEKN